MTRAFALAACLLLGSLQIEVRAQSAPAASTMRLEDFLIEIGNQFGIEIVAEEPLDELISVQATSAPLPAMIARALARHSYLLVYSVPWSGPLDASPNRLHVFARESGRSARVLNAAAKAADRTHASRVPVDAVARVDDIVEAAGSDDVRLAGALTLEIATASEAIVREEAVYALAQLDSRLGLDALVQALGDESPVVREAVVMAIADSRFPRAHDLLGLALADEDEAVRDAAADALDRLE